MNGKYIKTEGIITEELDIQTRIPVSSASREDVEYPSDMRWQDCFEQYYEHQKQRVREKSLEDSASRIRIAERILETSRNKSSLPENGNIQEYITLSKLEYLQDRLLAGEESRFKSRSLTTVNTTMGAIMAFIRYCHRHGWIKNVPPITKLSVDEVMKGRPVLVEEYEEMKNVVAGVVGERSSDSWKYVIRIIWESAFRISEVMNFSWDDDRKIHPVWPKRKGVHPTIIVPSTQKNGKIQEIPMLPGLERILEEVPKQNRSGWVVNPLPMDYEIKTDTEWLKPTKADLVKLAKLYNNSAIARACSVSETTVRKWLVKSQIERQTEFNCHQGEIDSAAITILRKRAEKQSTREAQRPNQRLSTERVSRIIAMIGKQANIIVQQPDKETGRRLK
ncbi:MAG: hypothetical protein JKY95_15640, partial [Planctomycetaceae bacterium]|nr:hypothetical protein [Planctomycetaceae bacterium]